MINQLKPTKLQAVINLVGGQVSWYDGDVALHDGQTLPSEEAIQGELTKLQAEYDAQAYSRKREAEYPSVQECVHAILDDTLDALQAKRASVKLKYPKGG
jgi:hypothetical protein